ncbi:MAG: hypothetical protein ACYDFU_05065 [Nitrospirota bacterium]
MTEKIAEMRALIKNLKKENEKLAEERDRYKSLWEDTDKWLNQLGSGVEPLLDELKESLKTAHDKIESFKQNSILSYMEFIEPE